MIWKTFSLSASVGHSKHRKSLSLADDVTVVEVVWWGTVTQPPPHMHAELSRGMWGQSLLIDHQRWNARYRNGQLNSHRRCGDLFFCLSHSTCEISGKKIVEAFGRKKMLRGWGNERRVRAVESGVGSGGQRHGSEQEIPPLIPPPFSPLFLHSTVSTLCLKFKFTVTVNGWMNGGMVRFQDIHVWTVAFDKFNSMSSSSTKESAQWLEIPWCY